MAKATTRREEALPPQHWREEWTALLNERDRITCVQRGPRGPPFATHKFGPSLLTRWLPWNWWSLDGTGWCYDGSWDEMRPCDAFETPPDWNGVVVADHVVAGDHWLPPSQLFAAACVALALAAHSAYREWARHEARRRSDGDAPPTGRGRDADADEEATSIPEAGAIGPGSWLQSGQAVPWKWDWSALVVLLSAMIGLAAGTLLPSASIPRNELYADVGLDDDRDLWPV